MNYYYLTTPSPLGEVTIQCTDNGISGVWFETHTTKPEQLGSLNPRHPMLQAAVAQLQEYFAGKRQRFDLAFDVQGTDFQRSVWQALTTIPCGETWSYKQLAEAINNPKAVRAVGLANGKNPVSVFVPCHRVIGANGKLTGYAGGVERKQKLLELEQRMRG